ncbi:deoxyribodipyrimidine photo-lyase [Sphingomonas sp. DBB INV C78]|uniref:cryptochrome/photolyase family protein n=1 Tax=Sphingomonas sp. DBB INV C78 TaxID=3349434 RepID=UPI0036D3596F
MAAPVILWFRQDMRLSDQRALAAATAEGPVVPLYVLDDDGAGRWAIGSAQRWWLHHSLTALGEALAAKGARLILRRGDAVDEVARLAREVGAERVHAIRHHEPWWQQAESELGRQVDLVLHDGATLAPPDHVRTGGGGRYRIFTPFWRALKEQMPPELPVRAPASIEGVGEHIQSDRLADWDLLPTRPDWAAGFADHWRPGEEGAKAALRRFLPHVVDYDEARNLPSITGSSRLSPHLHFGEISPATVWHHVAKQAGAKAEPFLREVGWRDFTANIVDLLPSYGRRNGREAWDGFPWRQSEADFTAWTKGRTGYPIVDAGMRELWAMGWMHNRVRMIVASFLTKHLLIDWRRGERWFWDTLVDADYGNNAVNWQWVAGTGIDSNPFGRIMAPLSQSAKFDAAGYIRRWVPEPADLPEPAIHDPHEAGCAPASYPLKLIGHREGRERALAAAKGHGRQ